MTTRESPATPWEPRVELSFSDLFIHPLLLFAGLALGAVGVWFAMPTRTRGPRELGAIVAAAGVGLVLLGLLTHGVERLPNVFFYVFALIGLGSALRVITHPRPVYAALFFILTVLSSAGMYILLSAEFLTFALVIIYAGAILITYLFVIMLATQVPSEDAPQQLEESDAVARAPVSAVFAGFVLLAALTGLFNSGLGDLPEPGRVSANEPLKRLPLKVRGAFLERGLPEAVRVGNNPDEGVVITTTPDETFAQVRLPWTEGEAFFKRYLVSVQQEMAERAEAAGRSYDVKRELLRVQTPIPGSPGETEPLFAANEELVPLEPGTFALFKDFNDREGGPALRIFQPNLDQQAEEPEPYWTLVLDIPETAHAVNLEAVGFALLAEHPLALELAGVILLMALVGAVVIARKQIEYGEAATEAAAEGRTA